MKKQFELTSDNTKAAKIYQAKVDEIEAFKNAYNDKIVDADDKLKAAQEELSRLNEAMVYETSRTKLKEISDRRRELRYEIEDLSLIKDADINQVILDKCRDITEIASNASAECNEFKNMIFEEMDRIRKEAEEKCKALQELHLSHPYYGAERKEVWLKASANDIKRRR